VLSTVLQFPKEEGLVQSFNLRRPLIGPSVRP